MSGDNMSIAVVGSINIDLVYKVPHIVKPGQTIHSTDVAVYFGGKGANQATTISKLGEEVLMIGNVGQDDYGKQAIQNLETAKVNTQYITQNGVTGQALIQVAASSENSIVLYAGANYHLTPEQMTKDIFNDCEMIVMQLEVPLEVIEHVAEIGRSLGKRIILNPAPAQQLSDNLIANIDILIPNENELATLADMDIDSLDAVEKAVEKLKARGAKCVIVTLGEEGCYYCSDDEKGFVYADKVQAVDTTGAGDSFVGAITVALHRKYALREAIEFATKVAAYVVTREGAQPDFNDFITS
ncbi:hypothetical protein A0U40_16370 [[Bacillus] sp. KCTC 13219]|nr:hypothetical protein A0U40_16370 [[Bacillus] sp. KCTC 13219]